MKATEGYNRTVIGLVPLGGHCREALALRALRVPDIGSYAGYKSLQSHGGRIYILTRVLSMI